MPVYSWSELPEAELNPLIYGKALEVPNAIVARIRTPKGNALNMHRHNFDQVTNVISGRIRWHIEGAPSRIVGPGDVMLMPAGVAHGGEVLEDAEYIDIFAPSRQDFNWYKQSLPQEPGDAETAVHSTLKEGADGTLASP
jgi:quercetin dioxygenase-like cupin family protein